MGSQVQGSLALLSVRPFGSLVGLGVSVIQARPLRGQRT